jgi:hypothetical protein
MTPLMDFTGFISEEGNRVIPRKPGGKKEKSFCCSATSQLQYPGL